MYNKEPKSEELWGIWENVSCQQEAENKLFPSLFAGGAAYAADSFTRNEAPLASHQPRSVGQAVWGAWFCWWLWRPVLWLRAAISRSLILARATSSTPTSSLLKSTTTDTNGATRTTFARTTRRTRIMASRQRLVLFRLSFSNNYFRVTYLA